MTPFEIVGLAFVSIMVVALIGVITMIACMLIESIKERDWYWIVFTGFSLLAVGFIWTNQDISVQITFEGKEDSNGRY